MAALRTSLKQIWKTWKVTRTSEARLDLSIGYEKVKSYNLTKRLIVKGKQKEEAYLAFQLCATLKSHV